MLFFPERKAFDPFGQIFCLTPSVRFQIADDDIKPPGHVRSGIGQHGIRLPDPGRHAEVHLEPPSLLEGNSWYIDDGRFGFVHMSLLIVVLVDSRRRVSPGRRVLEHLNVEDFIGQGPGEAPVPRLCIAFLEPGDLRTIGKEYC